MAAARAPRHTLSLSSYLLVGHLVTRMARVCAGLAAASPRIHDPRHQRVALFRPGLLARPSPCAPGGDRLAAARAGGLPAAGVAAAVDPLPDRPGQHPCAAASCAADARDRPDHRRTAGAPPAGGGQTLLRGAGAPPRRPPPPTPPVRRGAGPAAPPHPRAGGPPPAGGAKPTRRGGPPPSSPM